MNKAKTIGQARLAIGAITNHLRLYGMSDGVDSANKGLLEIVEWAYDAGMGKEYPCPVDEEYVRGIKW